MRRTNQNLNVLRFFALTLSLMLVFGSMLPALANEQEDALSATASGIVQPEQDDPNQASSAPGAEEDPSNPQRTTLSAATADELCAIFTDYAAGNIEENVVIVLTADIDLHSLSTPWQAPGTDERPFSGVFDGGGYTVSGIGQGDISSLLGVAAGALVQDVTIRTNGPLAQDETALYAGLFASGLQVTVLRCAVVTPAAPAALLLPMLLNGVLPDTSWYDDAPSAAAWTLTQAAQIAGIAALTESGIDFDGKIIYLDGEIDLSVLGSAMQPIGTQAAPFRGTIDGNPAGSSPTEKSWERATLLNMQLQQSGRDNVGFIGYGDGAKIRNLSFINAQVAGDDHVGIIAGVLNNGQVDNCAVAGKASGLLGVGGISGRLTGASTLQTSYSTAGVVGTTSVGGIAGLCEESKVQYCFSAGNVAGTTQVGGIAGSVHNTAVYNQSNTSLDHYSVLYCASSGAVRGVGLTGGLVGSGSAYVSATVAASYSSATVHGSSDSGGLLGGVGAIKYCYFSKQIIAPVPSDSFIRALIGYSGTAINSYAHADGVKGQGQRGKGITSGDNTNSGFFTPNNNMLCTQVINSAVFAPADLTMSQNDGYYLPVSGSYPRLLAFGDDEQTPPEFQNFSLISTQVIEAETTLFCNADNSYAWVENKDTPYQLPQLPDNFHWELGNGGVTDTSITLADPTLPDGENTIAIETEGDSQQLRLTAPVYQVAEIMLAAVPDDSALNISLNIPITIKDGALRLLKDELPVYFHSTVDALQSDQNTITKHNNSFILKFPEKVQHHTANNNKPSGDNVKAVLTQYNSYKDIVDERNGEIIAANSGHANAIQLRVQKDSQLKLEWPRDVISSGKYYTLTLGGLKDESGAEMALQTFYLRSLPNQAPDLYFDPDVYDYFGEAITDNGQGTQTVRILKNDPNYRSYTDGVIAEDDYDALAVQDNNVTFANIGNNTSPGITKANFHEYWGKYKLTYQVQDSEGETSREITRIYEVYCDIEVTANSQPIQPDELDVHLSNDHLLTIMEELAAGSATDLKTALEQQILLASGFHASRITCDGTVENLEMKLNIGAVTMQNLIQSGQFDGMTYDLVFEGTPVLQDIPLRVSASQGVRSLLSVVGNLNAVSAPAGSITTLEQVQQMIAPKIQYTKGSITKTIANATLEWSGTLDFDSLHTQFLTLTPKNILGLGFDLPPRIYSVTFTQSGMSVLPPIGPGTTSSESASDTFWEDVKAEIIKATPGKTVTAKVDYRHIYAPVSVFETLKEQPGVTLLMKLEKGIEIALPSSQVDLSRVESDRYQININIVPMDNLYISRDIPALGPMQQFYTVGRNMAYGTAKITIPVDEALRSYTGQLALYTFDNSTKEYTLMQRLVEGSTDGSFTFSLNQMPGECVIAPFPLNAEKTNPETGE